MFYFIIIIMSLFPPILESILQYMLYILNYIVSHKAMYIIITRAIKCRVLYSRDGLTPFGTKPSRE